jgi:hypothetical protein
MLQIQKREASCSSKGTDGGKTIKKTHFSCSVLEEHIKSEGEASAAMDQRVKHLFSTGWVYKFTTEFDHDTGTLVPKRIP